MKNWTPPRNSPVDSLLTIYFGLFKEAILNIFIFSSTWLTVVTAIGRYLAVCKPLQARYFISLRGTRISVAQVFVVSVLLNLPRFFHYQLHSTPCVEFLRQAVELEQGESFSTITEQAPWINLPSNHQSPGIETGYRVQRFETHLEATAGTFVIERFSNDQVKSEIESQLEILDNTCNCYLYQGSAGKLYKEYPNVIFYYSILWYLLAIAIPLCFLIVCNACLIQALRRSRQMQVKDNLALMIIFVYDIFYNFF